MRMNKRKRKLLNNLKICFFALILSTLFRVIVEKVPFFKESYLDPILNSKGRGVYLFSYYTMLAGILALFFSLKRKKCWPSLLAMSLMPLLIFWYVNTPRVWLYLILLAIAGILCAIDFFEEVTDVLDLAEDGLLEDDLYSVDMEYCYRQGAKKALKEFLPNLAKSSLYVAFLAVIVMTVSWPQWYRGKASMWGYTKEEAKDMAVATNRRDYQSTEDSFRWEGNRETLVKLSDDIWKTLSFDERMWVLQEVLNIECAYLGIDSCQLLVEDIRQYGIAGYYRDSAGSVSVEREYVKRDRSTDSVYVVLHEVYHALQYSAVEDYMELKKTGKLNENLRYYRDCEKWADEMKHYKSGAQAKDFSEFYAYDSQAMETSADQYAEDWVVEYYRYATDLYYQMYDSVLIGE